MSRVFLRYAFSARASGPIPDAAEHAARPEEDDQQEDDEDRGILQLIGQAEVDICCTRPMVRPPQNAPRMLPMPPSTVAGIHDDDEIEPD